MFAREINSSSSFKLRQTTSFIYMHSLFKSIIKNRRVVKLPNSERKHRWGYSAYKLDILTSVLCNPRPITTTTRIYAVAFQCLESRARSCILTHGKIFVWSCVIFVILLGSVTWFLTLYSLECLKRWNLFVGELSLQLATGQTMM